MIHLYESALLVLCYISIQKDKKKKTVNNIKQLQVK